MFLPVKVLELMCIEVGFMTYQGTQSKPAQCIAARLLYLGVADPLRRWVTEVGETQIGSSSADVYVVRCDSNEVFPHGIK